ncbi:MAG: nitrite/sulfite reductase [Burkholderiaceae bacterium]|jgi:sulfite reductase (NADPH) hemoprotein beta-component|nr:nitrite/sulfite reductase [Burkholderiaceae bacterium]
MYRYDQYDQTIVNERVAQFRDQVHRRLANELTEAEFLPLRLQNGLYKQLHAYMLRIAIPYGLLSSAGLRKFAHIAHTYDRGYAHISTRQNLQFNWIKLEDAPNILEELAKVQMHAIQTAGNCVRNITSDQFAGVAIDEQIDPRPYAEILRQWSTFQPEFAYLPRKFKIAINGAREDRVVTFIHDVGLTLVRNDADEIGFRVIAGGGLGRSPILGSVIREFLPWQHVMSYLIAILRVYNQYGHRDDLYKARIKVLVRAIGIDRFIREVEKEWAHIKDGPSTLTAEELQRVARHFTMPAYETLPAIDDSLEKLKQKDKSFANWIRRNVKPHKVAGYNVVVLSLKKNGVPPGNINAGQMEAIADLADRFSFGEVRTTHEQNLVLADVRNQDLPEVWQAARADGLDTPNIGLLTDIICCPGADYCRLAYARSIPVAQAITDRFDNLDYLLDIGDIAVNISGCVNACGHHHVAHIGISGFKKEGEELYVVSIGGSQGNNVVFGKPIGSWFAGSQIPEVVERLIQVYLSRREGDERFIDTVRRIGIDPFREQVYGDQA